MLAAILDAHVKDMGWAVCGSSSQSPMQEVTSDMKFTDMLGADAHANDMRLAVCDYSSRSPKQNDIKFRYETAILKGIQGSYIPSFKLIAVKLLEILSREECLQTPP